MFTTEKVNGQIRVKEKFQVYEKDYVSGRTTGTPGCPGTIWLHHGFRNRRRTKDRQQAWGEKKKTEDTRPQ